MAVRQAVSLCEGVLVLGFAVGGYAACALLPMLLWRAARRDAVDPRVARATAASLPFAALAALLPITHAELPGSPGALALRVLAAAALGLQVGWLLRLVLRRAPGLLRTSTWAGLAVASLLFAVVSLATRSTGPTPAVGPRAEAGPNVLLVTVDTLRADRLGAYGAGPGRTPEMDRWGERGIVYEDAVASVPLTCPSHASILSGLYPVRHGALRNGSPLPRSTPTLPERLAEQGYRTGAIVSGYTLKSDACGLADRFGSYEDDLSAWPWFPDRLARLRLFDLAGRVGARIGVAPWRADRPAGPTTDRALRWLDRHGDEPFFLWVHYFDPHVPYAPPADHRPVEAGARDGHWYHGIPRGEREAVATDPMAVREMIALYDGEVAYVDAQLARLRAALDRRGLDTDTLLILTADHGESLGEHEYYFEHSNYLYEEELRVPLIVVPPGGASAPRRVAGQARLIDVAPTVLGYLGLPPATLPAQGRDLRASDPAAPETPAFAAVRPGVWDSGRAIYAVRSEGYKLIWTAPEWRFYGMRLAPREELYHLASDPGELRNLVAASPSALAGLREALKGWRSEEPAAAAGPGGADPQLEQRLRSLGYVE